MVAPQLKSITKLSGKHVLVLGGTSGIGFAVAAAALEHGASIVVSSSQITKVEKAVSRLKTAYPTDEFHSRITGFTCNLGIPEKLEENILALLKECTTAAEGGHVLLDHIVITACDVPGIKPVQHVTVDYLRDLGTVRFIAPLILAKHVGPYIRQATTSSITLTSGVRTLKPAPDWSAVVSYGGAVEAMARGLALDLAPVRVNCVSPGVVHTELVDNFLPKEIVDGFLKQMAEETVVGHVAKPEDVAEAYIYAIKDNFCTGSLIHTNGGMLLK